MSLTSKEAQLIPDPPFREKKPSPFQNPDPVRSSPARGHTKSPTRQNQCTERPCLALSQTALQMEDASFTVKSTQQEISLGGYAINVRANDVCIRESDTLKAQAREPHISDVFSCFPGEVAPVSNELLQRIEGTLHESEQGTICNADRESRTLCDLLYSSKSLRLLFVELVVTLLPVVESVEYLVQQHVQRTDRDRRASGLCIFLHRTLVSQAENVVCYIVL